MKKIRIILFAFSVLLFFVQCSKDSGRPDFFDTEEYIDSKQIYFGLVILVKRLNQSQSIRTI